MWIDIEEWNMAWMLIGMIGVGALVAGLLLFIEWRFSRRNKR